MPTIEVTPENFGAAIREHLEEFRRQIIMKAALNAVAQGLREALRLTKAEGAIDMGHYSNAFEFRPLPDGAELTNDAPHSGVIEHGRRAGAPGPPLQPILDWVLRKLVPEGTVLDYEAEEVAFLIRRAIHENETPPRAIMLRALPKIEAAFLREIKKIKV